MYLSFSSMDYQANNQRVIALYHGEFLTVSRFYLENWGGMECEQVIYYVHKLLKTFLILAGTAKMSLVHASTLQMIKH